MLQKIPVKDAEKFTSIFSSFAYSLNPYYLAYNGFYEQEDDEVFLYERDVFYRNDFPFIALPRNKKHWARLIANYVSQDRIEELKKEEIEIKEAIAIGSEYYYKTKDFIAMNSPKMKGFRKHCVKFEKSYTFKIKNTYSKPKILQFLDTWEKSQKNKNELFSMATEYERFCIEKCKSIDGKWLFLEIDGELAGYNLSYQLNKQHWIGVQQKVLYQYKGISRFLLHKRASQFPKTEAFSLGIEAHDKGISEFKEGLHPFKKVDRYYVITAPKLSPL